MRQDRYPPKGLFACPACLGTGQVQLVKRTMGGPQNAVVACRRCIGRGVVGYVEPEQTDIQQDGEEESVSES